MARKLSNSPRAIAARAKREAAALQKVRSLMVSLEAAEAACELQGAWTEWQRSYPRDGYVYSVMISSGYGIPDSHHDGFAFLHGGF